MTLAVITELNFQKQIIVLSCYLYTLHSPRVFLTRMKTSHTNHFLMLAACVNKPLPFFLTLSGIHV